MNNHSFFVFLFLAVVFMGCKKQTNTKDINKDTFDKLDGYYALESAFTQEPIDINLDGKLSKDMLSEIPDLKLSTINVVVYSKGKTFFTLWPEEEKVSESNLFSYNLKGLLYEFNFDGQSRINLKDVNDPILKDKFLPPENITLNNDRISADFTKTINTSIGKQKIVIHTVYKRNKEIIRVYE